MATNNQFPMSFKDILEGIKALSMMDNDFETIREYAIDCFFKIDRDEFEKYKLFLRDYYFVDLVDDGDDAK